MTRGIQFMAILVAVIIAVAFCLVPHQAKAEKPIVLGCPLSTAFLYGWDAERSIRLAVEEINASGGVNVGGVKRPLKVEVMDTRDLEPGVPVSEALLVVEKLILEKGADFIMGGPVRSEAALAAMDLLSKYKKVSILTTGVLTPKYHARVAKNYDKFKYCFRITGEAKWMVGGEIIPCLIGLGKKYGLNRLFIMIQDVAHARAGGGIIAKIMAKKGWKVLGKEIYPTGTSDFSMGLLKARRKKAQVILIWMDMPQTSILLKQWYDMKIPALPFGSIISAAEQPGFWKATEGKGEYCLANVVNAGNAPCNATPWTMKFVNAYKERWGLEPEGYGASSSYMAPYVLKAAIEKAGSLEPNAVVEALEDIDMMGVYGRIRFDKKSHQIIPSLDPKKGAVGTIFQWQAGKRVVVFPESIAMGQILLPPWMSK
ncbi:MAG: ABC transporter substrate-binding protein [Deltaproteobacteria bacterium]|nr:ABC transporter substrate-binding protein [Deltaproteobacteria bacterium]MBW1930615.1 ABC transporter substrate-binding protein [Deltaproteobacteria bacterium]MBW2025734.1 ABC transporter substrate-binding protein [Deltaproteobacteria bacterium]MBW2124275.1 ABC transporter substrate-binding protein [Deltaproteobacteria bacterium]RLB23535.1 MAG: ABC transporter substrate-binding protein [Deltaproteobacteria bacterium]